MKRFGFIMFSAVLASVGMAGASTASTGDSRQEAQDALSAASEALAFVQKDAARPALAAQLRALEQGFAAADKPSGDWPGLAARARLLQRHIILSHPLLSCDDLLLIERDVLTTAPDYKPSTRHGPYYDGEQAMDQCYGHNARKGGGLYVLKGYRGDQPRRVDLVAGLKVPCGTNKGMLLSDGAFASPALSYDGKAVLFAWASGGREKWRRENRFNLFRVNVDGTGLARLTDANSDDFDPCWLPDGDVVFISTRRGGFGRCHPRPVPTYTLFRMHADGSDIQCLSYHETNEWQPTVEHNGMILYTRWDYIDRDATIAIHPWVCFPDGRNPIALHGNYPLPLTTMAGSGWPDGRANRPLCENSLKAIPGSGKYVAVASPHHNQSYGSLVMIDPTMEDDNKMSQVRRLTPEVRFPENEGGELAYGTPWPLREDLYLCNYRDTVCVIYYPAGKGVLVPLYKATCLRPINPIPIQARPRPPIIPSPLPRPNETTGKMAKATVYVVNIYDSDELGRLPAGVKTRSMRVVQVFPKTTPLQSGPRVSRFSESLVRASLGTVPIEADGSVYFEAPAGKELYFQLIDDDGLAVQSMRSGTYLHAGESLACAGCHENRQATPRPTPYTPTALRRAASKITPELQGAPGLVPAETVNYYRLVKPVLDARCADCHRKAGKGPEMTYGSLRKYMSGYAGDLGSLWQAARAGGSRTVPGNFGAHASELYTGGYLTGQSDKCTGKVKLSDQELHRITLWLDLNSNELGAYHDVEAQKRGELVRPDLE